MHPSRPAGLEPVLANAVETPAELPEAAIRFETVRVAMRDGVQLATHLHLPPKAKAPCIAVRSPYGRAKYAGISMALARRGYVVICQDVRGTGDSEPDHWDFYVYEQEDSDDFVNWVAIQPWYDEFIGAMGGSYDGGTQFCMATNPKMTAIMPEVAGLGIAPSPGVRFHMYLNAYSKTVGKGKDKVSTSNVDLEAQMKEETLATGYFNEPMGVAIPNSVFKLCPELAGVPEAEQRAWLWAHFNALTPAKRVEFLKIALDTDTFNFDTTTKLNPLFGAEVDPDALLLPRTSVAQLCRSIHAPAMLVTGWYDWCLGDTLYTWEQLAKHGDDKVRTANRLLISPGAHNAPGYHEGDREVPALRRTYRTSENLELLLQWYGAVRDGTADAIPAVTYYLMGANEWRTASAWPPAEARPLKLYLTGDAGLVPEAPVADAKPRTYVYDPDQPTPTMGGSILSNVYRPGSVNVAEVQRRPDVLAYTTPVLEQDIDVVGPLRLVLYAGSSAPETDFYGRLSDVFPDGRAVQLQSGMVRTRYRERGAPTMNPGSIYRFEIDMWATANRFVAGHRLRLDISSTDFPKFERNRNRAGTAGASITATQSIFHDLDHASHLVLPVIGAR